MSGKTWLSTRRWDRGSDRAADPRLPLFHWWFRPWTEFFALLLCSEATYKLSSPLRSSVTTAVRKGEMRPLCNHRAPRSGASQVFKQKIPMARKGVSLSPVSQVAQCRSWMCSEMGRGSIFPQTINSVLKLFK